MTKFPLFIWPILILLVELALQYFPATGIFLMFLLAPAWSVLLINAALILIAVDAWRGALPKAAVAIPAALYAGYFGFYAVSMWGYLQLDGQLAAANAGQRIAFDPTKQDIVVSYAAIPLGRAPAIGPGLVANYNLYGVYENNRREGEGMQAVKLLNRSQCDNWKRQPGGRIRTSGFHVDHIFVRNACIGEFADSPMREPITLRPAAKEEAGSKFQPVELTSLDVTGADGRTATLTTGTTSTLTLIPTPIIGCTLISSKASWDCFAYFGRTTRAIGGDHEAGDDGRAEATAQALGLTPRKVTRTGRRILGSAPGDLDPSEIPNG